MVLISQLQQRFSCRHRRTVVAAALFAAAAILSGCSASLVGDHLPTAAGGLPEATPQRPAQPAAYPAVHDLPPKRQDAVLTDDEQKKLEEDLIAARNRTAGAASGASADANANAKPAGGARNP
jgi:hypothetical protein